MLATLLTTILPALVPAGVDIIKGAANRLLGGSQMQPSNFEEYVKLEELGIKRLQAIAELDKPASNISVWVANLRASCRYIAVYAIIGIWAIFGALSMFDFIPGDSQIVQDTGELARVAFSFLFGDRMYRFYKSSS